MDLGTDPRVYIHYPHGRSYYIDESVEEALLRATKTVDYDDVERVFWPFVRSDVRQRYGGPQSRGRETARGLDISGVHLFDRRRLSFLRTGSMNQRRIDQVPAKMFVPLAGKSRDELEQTFMADEARLSHKEIKAYVYVIFDLQRHFNALIAREMPQGLDQKKVEARFLEDICRLNRDRGFWAGMDMQVSLHEYLVRYLIMFFDSDYDKPRFFEDLEFAKFNRRRYMHKTFRPVATVYSEAGTVFGVGQARLKAMTRRELHRMYRKKARELHPDQGGSHDRFIELGRIYDELMRAKS